MVEDSPTSLRKAHNARIWNKLLDVVQSGMPEEEIHKAFLADFELFCAAYVRLDNIRPMFTAPWQSEVFEITESHSENLFILCRKVGKTAFLTAYVLWKCIANPGRRLIFVAPTELQLFGFEDAVKALDRMPFVMDTYVKPKDGGRRSAEGVVFASSWSEIAPICLAQKQKGSTKRGIKGSDMVIDEIQNVLKVIRETVLDDVMADAYTEKKQSMFGTPVDVVNPHLEMEWLDAQTSDDVGTFTIDIWRGVDEGCITRKYVRDRFRKLSISCPWGRYKGMCGKRDCPGQAYKSSKKNDKQFDGWKCDECCLLSETFVAENLGQFPKIGGRFFPKPYLEAAATEAYDVSIPHPEIGHHYIMAIDFGAGLNPGQIGVWDKVDQNLILNHWREVPIIEATQIGGHRSYDPIIRRTQDIYAMYGLGEKNQIKRVFADATSVGLQVTNDLTKGPHAIPVERIWCNESAEKKEWIGVIQSGPYKSKEIIHYRKMLLDGRIKVSLQEPFYSKWMFEHNNITVVRAQQDNYLVFKEPPGGTVDIVDMCGLASLEFSDEILGEGSYLGYVSVGKAVRDHELEQWRRRRGKGGNEEQKGLVVVIQ